MTALLEPVPFLISSWLLSHRGWQLLMGAGCPQGTNSSGKERGAGGREEAPHPGPPPPFSQRGSPTSHCTGTPMLHSGVPQLSEWELKTPHEKVFGFFAKTPSCPFCPLLCPLPQVAGGGVSHYPLPKFGVSSKGYLSQVIPYGLTSSITGVLGGHTWGFACICDPPLQSALTQFYLDRRRKMEKGTTSTPNPPEAGSSKRNDVGF